MKDRKAFSEKNLMNLFVKERSFVSRAHCSRLRQVGRNPSDKRTDETMDVALRACQPRIRKQQKTHGWWREALPGIIRPEQARRKARAPFSGVLPSLWLPCRPLVSLILSWPLLSQ